MMTIRALTGGATYASRHLSSNDYYSEKERVIGQWMGQGAQRLGLKGAVEMDQFDAIRQGLDPATGEFLRPRQSADRFNTDGERTGTARSLYDFTVSAPKSVSIQSFLDPRLLDAHHQASTRWPRRWSVSRRRVCVSSARMKTERPATWSLRPISMTPAGNSIRRSTRTWSRPISPTTAWRTAGRRFKLPTSTNSART